MNLRDNHRRRLAKIGLNLCIVAVTQRNQRRQWTRQWLARGGNESVYYRLVRELSLEDPDSLRNFIRLNKQQYQEVLSLVSCI